MEHLEGHNHAFIDNNNKVIAVVVFQESDHDSQLLEDIKNSYGAKQTVCCCTFGFANAGDFWTGTEFQVPSPHKGWIWDSTTKLWNPPVPEPDDGFAYYWDNEAESWVRLN